MSLRAFPDLKVKEKILKKLFTRHLSLDFNKLLVTYFRFMLR